MTQPVSPTAFPVTSDHYADKYCERGMSLRDYFAAKAMQGTAAQYVHDDSRPGTWDQQLAADAYAIADAMMAARIAP